MSQGRHTVHSMPPTPTHQLADILLAQPLADYVTNARRNGVSWRRIALNLRDDTDGQVDVTHETLRTWFPEAGS